jgi:transcriptional regulator with XRE-family HTH domain
LPRWVDAATGEFGSRVRSRRLSAGLSQEVLAERSGLHRNYVGSLERGERNVALLNILRLAEALACDPSELVAGLRPDKRTDGPGGRGLEQQREPAPPTRAPAVRP